MVNIALLNLLAANHIKSSKVRITTTGGAVYIAPMDRITVYRDLGRLFAMWDFRHGLTHDTHYNRSIPFEAIENMEVLKNG